MQIFQVDAFADRPFGGNPAGVCVASGEADPGWMQAVAGEMNLSETAFLSPLGAGRFGLRWFTPTIEVDLCGHATLASAHVLWEDEHLPPDTVARFHTRSGLLTARRDGDWIELDFPVEKAEKWEPSVPLGRGLGAEPLWVGKSRLDLLVELADEKTIRTLKPDMNFIAGLEVRGVIVTSRAVSMRFDFVSRFFAPGAGVPEDPVTGSAHCTLGPFWAARLQRDELVGYQVSDRGGTVRVRLQDDRTLLAGQAVTVMRGTLSA